MPYTGPRRAPLTDAQRARNARNATGAQLTGGATSATRRVDSPRTPQVYQPPQDPGGVLAYEYFSDGQTGATNGALPHGSEFGDAGGVGPSDWYSVHIIGVDQNEVQIVQQGWYALHIYATFGGTSAGDAVMVEATSAGPIRVCVGNATHDDAFPAIVAQACTTPFYLYPEDCPVGIIGAAYGPSGAYVSELQLTLTKFGGITPSE